MLSKVHLTLHSSMSGSRRVIIPSWLSGSWRSFLYISVYSCYFFLISSASVVSIALLSFIVPIFAWNGPLGSLLFLKRSLVFPILLFSSIYLHCSLKKVVILHSNGYIFPFLLCLLLLFTAICKATSKTILPFAFLFLGMVLIPASCSMSRTSIHILQALCLSDLIPWIYFSLPLYNHYGFD